MTMTDGIKSEKTGECVALVCRIRYRKKTGHYPDEQWVLSVLAQVCNQPSAVFLNESHKRPLILYKHIARYLLRNLCKMKYKDISSFLGVSHSHCVESVKKVEWEINHYDHVRKIIEEVERQVNDQGAVN